jgi:hypothetical protein
VLIVGHVDHTASFYAPLLDAFALANVPACAYDPAGYGFSDSGKFPRTSARLANELSGEPFHSWRCLYGSDGL